MVEQEEPAPEFQLFIGVPTGTHQLTVYSSGLRLRSERAPVAARSISQSAVTLGPRDRTSERGAQQLIVRGADTLLRGEVTDQEKRPLAGVKVTVMLPSGAVSVMTGQNGKYVLRDLRAGAYRVLVLKFGYEREAQSIIVRSGGTETRDFRLKTMSSPLINRLLEARRASGGTDHGRVGSTTQQKTTNEKKIGQLIGRVIDGRSRKAISGAAVSIQGQPGVETGPDGSYGIANLPEGHYRVRVRKLGFLEQEKVIRVSPGSSTREDFFLTTDTREDDRSRLTIRQLPTTGGLRGQVLDAKTGSPVAGASILMTGASGVVTSRSGLFNIGSLTPGEYQVTVRRSGYLDGSARVTIRPGQITSLNLRLSPRAMIQVRPSSS